MTNGEFRYCGELQAACASSLDDLFLALACLDPSDGPHPGLRLNNIQHSAQTLLRGFAQRRHSARIGLAHAPDVMAKVAFENKLRQNRLIQRGRMPVE